VGKEEELLHAIEGEGGEIGKGPHRVEAVVGQGRGAREGKSTSNVRIYGRLIEGDSCACSENTLRQSCN